MKPEDPNNSNFKHMYMDYSKYVESQTYNEFIKNNTKEIEKINWRLDELKYMIDDIINNLKNKVSDKDLKTLEGS